MTDPRTFINVLHAKGPAADRADKLGLTVNSSATGRRTS